MAKQIISKSSRPTPEYDPLDDTDENGHPQETESGDGDDPIFVTKRRQKRTSGNKLTPEDRDGQNST